MVHATEIWHGESAGAALLRLALTPASLLYGVGWRLYLGAYAVGLKRAQSPHTPVVCIGSLMVGGSGKTPMTLHVTEVLQSLGRMVAISCSAYGSPASESATVAPDGVLDPVRWGDEPALIRERLPEVPIIVGRDRVRAAQLCHEHCANHVLLLDDGYQHLPLKKHISIVLDDPAIENRMCLPAGPFREPSIGLRRATMVLPRDFGIVEKQLPFVQGDGVEISLNDAGPVHVLCAIGRPEKFIQSLRDAGIDVKSFDLLPDHAKMEVRYLRRALDQGLPIVVTEKDWVKIRSLEPSSQGQWLIARHGVSVEPADAFREELRIHLEQAEKT